MRQLFAESLEVNFLAPNARVAQVEIMYLEDVLSDEFTLMDVAYIYSWRSVSRAA